MKQNELPLLFDGQCQRWHKGRAAYRPAGEPINTRRYGVEVVTTRVARTFVEKEHYSHTWPSSRLAVGLFETHPFGSPKLVGIANFGEPLGRNAVEKWAGISREHGHDGAELNRFVLRDHVPANGESWFLARAFELLTLAKPCITAVIAYADPVAIRISGELHKPGHVGTIYQASNAAYAGVSSSETFWVTRDGQIITRRLISKVRNGEVGAEYAYRRLMELGAPRRKPRESERDWLDRALGPGGPFERHRHPGKHVYAFGLGNRRIRRRIREMADCGQPFPKPFTHFEREQ